MKRRILPYILTGLVVLASVVLTNHARAAAFTTLYNFSSDFDFTNSDGSNPFPGLVLSDDTLYGVADDGGLNGFGTAFAINVDGSGFQTLNSFGGEAAVPSGALTSSDGELFGSTSGDADDDPFGTLFELDPNSPNDATILYQFTGAGDGASPQDQLVVSAGLIYGTTTAGGCGGLGTVFSFDMDSMVFTPLVEFMDTNGAIPFGGLALDGNTLYGTTLYGGDFENGTVFKVNTDGSCFQVLYSFSALDPDTYTNADGAYPWDTLVLAGHTLFGTCEQGGAGISGTVFSMDTSGSNFTVLHNFTSGQYPNYYNSDGAIPIGGLALGNDVLYGEAELGGSAGNGTLFAVHTDGSDFETLYHFREYSNDSLATNSDGAFPSSTPLVSSNVLYGTAPFGGAAGSGTIFSYSLSNSISFTADQYYGPVPFTVQYTAPSVDRAGNNIAEWNWDFGDGITSAEQSPSHTYVTPGAFRPILTAVNDFDDELFGSGPSAYPSGANLIVNGGFETGDFSGWNEIGDFSFTTIQTDPTRAHSGQYGAQIAGNDTPCYLAQTLPTTPGAQYFVSCWLYGDGATPNEFLALWNGTAIIDLTNVGAVGWTNIQFTVSATSNQTEIEFGFRDDPSYFGFDDVSVTLASPTVLFTASPTSGAPVLGVQFAGPATDGQGHNIVSWNWNFGDGSASTEQSPFHNYNNVGVYDPSLVVTNDVGSVLFGSGPSIDVAFTNLTFPNLLFDGGFEYGDFVGWNLSGENDFSYVDTNSSAVHSGSYGADMAGLGTPSYLTQDFVTLPGAEYLLSFWLYADGITPNEFTAAWNDDVLIDMFDMPAIGWTNMQFTMVADTTDTQVQFGFRDDPSYFGFDDVSASLISPVVNFTATPTNGAPPLTVHFYAPSVDAQSNSLSGWVWRFGDGSVGYEQNPVHTYATIGSFTPYFIATNNGTLGLGPDIVVGYPNLIANGGFETGDLSDWSIIGDPTYFFIDPDYAHSGALGGQFGNYAVPSYIAQTFPTIPGGTYLISCWLFSDGTPPSEFQVVWNGATNLDLIDPPETGWTNIQLSVIATGPSSTVEFGFRDDSTWLGFDDVSIGYVSGGVATLNYAASGSQLTLSWPASAFSLQSAADLGPPTIWNPVLPAPPPVLNGQYIVTTNMDGPQEFFKLSP